MKKDIAALVANAKNENQNAYEALYQETKQSVYFTCLGLLKSEADAVDLMQERYLTAFLKLDMLENPDKFAAWINRIAINKCKNFLIQKRNWLPLEEETEVFETVEESNADFLPESYVTEQSKRKIILQIMQEVLSDVQYRTVILYYYDELTLTEIAELMECSEGTVKSRLFSSREKIKEGVLKYEQKHDDKLYSIAALPFMARLLQREAKEMQMPEVSTDFLQAIKIQKKVPRGTHGKRSVRNGGQGMLKTVQGKIIVIILAILVVGGGATAIIIAVSQRSESGDAKATKGNNPVYEEAVVPEEEEALWQVPFIDSASGEDYLSGHILSIAKLYSEDYYLALDDNHNIYQCEIDFDTYIDYDEVVWNITLLYEDTNLESIENCATEYHYNINTGEDELGEDGHEKCVYVYGNGYLYIDGQEYNLNSIVPVKQLDFSGSKEIFVIDTNGNLHHWNAWYGLADMPDYYEPIGILNYYEEPVYEEFKQGNCVSVFYDNVLLADGRLVYCNCSTKVVEEEVDGGREIERIVVDTEKKSFEENILLEGMQALYGRSCEYNMMLVDSEGKIHDGGPYISGLLDEYHRIIPCDYEGGIQGVYKSCGSYYSMLVKTTEGYYYSDTILQEEEADPLEAIQELDEISTRIREIAPTVTVSEFKVFVLLDDGTLWVYLD